MLSDGEIVCLFFRKMFEDDEDFENLEFDAGILEEKSRKIRNFIFIIKLNGIELEIGIVFYTN